MCVLFVIKKKITIKTTTTAKIKMYTKHAGRLITHTHTRAHTDMNYFTSTAKWIDMSVIFLRFGGKFDIIKKHLSVS